MDSKSTAKIMITKLVLSGIGFLLILVSGIWLSKLGKPYGTLVFNMHKLVAMGFIVLTFITSRNMFKEINISSFMWILIVLAAISVITILLSGGILSQKEQITGSLVIIHKISSALLLISLSGGFYLGLR
jgi:hypothetical protein